MMGVHAKPKDEGIHIWSLLPRKLTAIYLESIWSLLPRKLT